MTRRLFGFARVALVVWASPLRSQTLEGVWRTEGYGNVFEVHGTSLQMYEVTATTCIRTSALTRESAGPPGAVASFKAPDDPDGLVVLPDRAPNRMRFHNVGAASDIVAVRQPALPTSCSQPVPNTPESNFDVFARTWTEQYGFFGVRGVNWQNIVDANRPKVGAATTPTELFEIFRGMVEPLEDAHTGVAARAIGQGFGGFRDRAHQLAAPDRQRALELVEKKYLIGPIRSWCRDQVQFGMLADSIGYLRIKSFGRYTEARGFENGLMALEAAMDTIFANAAGLRGIVIDVRLNNGGADPYGLAIAARLTSAEYTAYAKQARFDPADQNSWTPLQPNVVRPSARAGFKGPIVELIGLHTVSAGETFTQALMKRSPKVVRIGENTQGVFSDVLGRHLPNAWVFRLPNERFVTDGKAYDGPGIPPDIRVPVFPKSDLDSAQDGALVRAVQLLKTNR
ncbi:MAG TPA: S41 family peptidase [Gemmatimonadaceae bacterium]|nr:S41 family peptidase [Gemmatimonadaceae bacterium]